MKEPHPDQLDALVDIVRRASRDPTVALSTTAKPDVNLDLWLTGDDLGPIAVQVKSIGQMRKDNAIGQLAAATLQLQRMVGSRENCIAMLVTESFSNQTADELAQFMADDAPDVGWVVFDQHGGWATRIPRLDFEERQAAPRPVVAPSSATTTRRYSDLNRWLLKILLLAEVDEPFWSGTHEAGRSVHHLHDLAGVSTGKAHAFFHEFADAGYLLREPELRLVRIPELIDEWFSLESVQAPTGLPTRWLFGRPRSLDDIITRQGPDYAIASWSAVQMDDLAHAATPSLDEARWQLHILSGGLEDAVRAWNLEPCQQHEAQLWLYRPTWVESIRRGVVNIDNKPVVDAFQAALDVRPRTARGFEQARYIVERLGLVDT